MRTIKEPARETLGASNRQASVHKQALQHKHESVHHPPCTPARAMAKHPCHSLAATQQHASQHRHHLPAPDERRVRTKPLPGAAGWARSRRPLWSGARRTANMPSYPRHAKQTAWAAIIFSATHGGRSAVTKARPSKATTKAGKGQEKQQHKALTCTQAQREHARIARAGTGIEYMHGERQGSLTKH